MNAAGGYALGIDGPTGQPFLSIPVANRLVDYEEYYAISAGEHALFKTDATRAGAFADRCRCRDQDDRSILKAGADRGQAV